MCGNYKRRLLPIAILLLLLLGCGSADDAQKADYGVFIGVDAQDRDILYAYRTVVIDAEYYTWEEINDCKRHGVTVYSYLNIGSIEDFREAFGGLQACILGEYENWPGEYWVDVSRQAWRDHIAESAAVLAQKGVDGFFLDNADVYYQYPRRDIFQGLIAIIEDLEQYQKDILINGGDVFVAKAVVEPEQPLVRITGVNQECVFTNIRFETGELTRQEPDTTQYYQDYLRRCKLAGLNVYLTEYADDATALRPRIEDYCAEQQFACYIAPSLLLEG